MNTPGRHPVRRGRASARAASVGIPALLLVSCSCNQGQAPDIPVISGPGSAAVSVPISYSVWSTDPDGDRIAYRFEWGDGWQHNPSIFHRSGDTVEFGHAYSDTGVFLVRAQAVDTRGKTSDWCEPEEVQVSDGVPPEPFWEPDSEDTAAIHGLIVSGRASFGCDVREGRMVEIDTVLPGSSAERLRYEMLENPYRQRFRCDSLQHCYSEDSLVFGFDLYAWVDTVHGDTFCAVGMAETIPGLLRMHAFSYTRYLRDTMLVPSPGETLWLQVYDSVFTDTSMVVEKRLYGTSQDGCLLVQHNGEWKTAKLQGGSRFHAPAPDGAPYLGWVVLQSGAGCDTILWRPDTLHHGIQRLYQPEELPDYRVGDSVRVCALAPLESDPAGYTYLGGSRHELADWVGLDSPGVCRFHAEIIPVETLYEIDGDYVATVWGIRIFLF